jgi:hypothetical protein
MLLKQHFSINQSTLNGELSECGLLPLSVSLAWITFLLPLHNKKQKQSSQSGKKREENGKWKKKHNTFEFLAPI